MRQVTRKEIKDKYGIDLPPGEYRIEKDGGSYNIYTIKDDTLGCLLLGRNTVKGGLTSSQATYFDLMDNYLLPAHEKGEPIRIIIE